MPGVPSVLQPAAHAFLMAREDVETAVGDLPDAAVWASPGGITPIGFHLAHLTGSTDRLLTYARGATLDEAQRAALGRERMIAVERPPASRLLEAWRTEVDHALAQLAATDPTTLGEARTVGRAQLPSTVLGLLFHAAEHASRHTGQVVTTAKLVRAMASD